MASMSFDQIPANILVPLFYAEVRPGQEPFTSSLKLLLVGHKAPAANAVVNTPYALSQTTAEQLFGRGSMVEAMFRKAKMNAPFAEIWGMCTAADTSGAAATGRIQVSSAPTLNGNLTMFIAGYSVQIPVLKTDTRSGLALRLRNAIVRNAYLPVLATIDGSDATVINLTAKWVGVSGVNISIERTVFGSENRLANALLTVTPMGGAAGNQNISPALAALGDQQFDVIAVGFKSEAAQLAICETFMDHVSGRWSPYQQLYGHMVSCASDTFSDLITDGAALNDPHMSLIATTGSPTPPWEWAAAWAAILTQHLSEPPEMSRPIQALRLLGVEPARVMDNWYDISERQSLIEAGYAVWRCDQARRVFIDRTTTTYKTNVWGDQDSSWRDAETLFQASYFVKFVRGAITGAFPRAALTDDDLPIDGFASPGKIRDEIMHAYKFLVTQGLVENAELFDEALIVERDELNANRVNVLAKPDLVNQLRIVAMIAETHLQLSTDNV